MIYLGSHVERKDPLQGAVNRQADVVQIFLSPPQAWAAPKIRGDEHELLSAELPIFVHAPYLANPASANPAVREKTRRCLQEQTTAAAAVGALLLAQSASQVADPNADRAKQTMPSLKKTNLTIFLGIAEQESLRYRYFPNMRQSVRCAHAVALELLVVQAVRAALQLLSLLLLLLQLQLQLVSKHYLSVSALHKYST